MQLEGTTYSVEQNSRKQKSTPPPKKSEREKKNHTPFHFRAAIEKLTTSKKFHIDAANYTRLLWLCSGGDATG